VKFLIFCALTFASAFVALQVQRGMSWPYWSYFAICSAGAVVCYFVNVVLIRAYVDRNAPGIALIDRVVPDANAWETTAGRGIVPKWVSLIGLMSLGFFLAIPFELLARILR
jgi:hypothetical protein